MQIILVRHGRPDCSGWCRCTPREMDNWIEDYDRANVIPRAISPHLAQLVKTANAVVCSPLPRSIQTKRYLLGDQPHAVDELFSEAHLPHLDWSFPRLPARLWKTLFRLAWFYGLSRHAESIRECDERARLAADRLAELAWQNGTVLLVGHEVMNMLIARQLRARGWLGPRLLLAKDYWHPTVYRKAEGSCPPDEK